MVEEEKEIALMLVVLKVVLLVIHFDVGILNDYIDMLELVLMVVLAHELYLMKKRLLKMMLLMSQRNTCWV
jgi:hypothetical protein